MMMIRNVHTSSRYDWGAGCEGWRLLDRRDLRVIRERVPPGAGEVRHRHQRARQLFVVLAGALDVIVGDVHHELGPGDALEIEPGHSHQVGNQSQVAVEFLVISAPSTDGDREDLP
jgi:mannose-6-phosphate isomerase-like protein (cupin superfamily)